MVLHKRLDYGINGYQIPPLIKIPKYAKGKRSARKKTVDSRMCAFDLLAAVAGKLLLEGESSSTTNKVIGTPNAQSGKETIKGEQFDDEKPVKDKAYGNRSCSESTFGPHFVTQGLAISKACSLVVKSNPNVSNKEACTEKRPSHMDELYENNVKNVTLVDRNASNRCSLEDRMDKERTLHGLATSNRSVKIPFCGDQIPLNSFSPKLQDEKLFVYKDDDENSYGCTNPSFSTNKALRDQGTGHRKQLATKFWKVATTMTKDRELSNTEMKPSFHNRKVCYTRQRTQRSAFKRRKLFQRRPMSAPNGRIDEKRVLASSVNGRLTSYGAEDFHVKLTIKSFKVPELFIEIPETSTVGSLKRTVMEAVTAILGGGLRIGVLLQDKKVRDDSKTLVQAGISHGDKLDDLGFTLEPSASQSLPMLANTDEPQLLLPSDFAEPLTRFPVVIPPSDGGKFDTSPEYPLIPQGNCLEIDHDSGISPVDALSLEKIAEDARPLIAIPSMSVEALPIVPVRKQRRSEMAQRRIRRPFSVTEVEALVHAVEKLGTGRWRDVKIRAFDNAKHRTYVDLKDKWKTLVHTARISPQQRRGEPVPQELLDRVLAAHAYWSQQQAKLQGKPSAEACLLI